MNLKIWRYNKNNKINSWYTMDKRDSFVLSAILVGAGIPVLLMILVANGIIDSPIP